MECEVDVDGRDILSVFNLNNASCSSIHFVSDYALDKIHFWSLEG